MKQLRAHRTVIHYLMIALMAFWQIGQPLQADTFYWDADADNTGNNTGGTNLGGTGTWDTTTANWWDLTNDVVWPNTNADIAIFTGAFAVLPTLNTVTLATGGVTANQLRFERSGYTIAGETLTLAGASAGLHANLGESATISSLIAGTADLTMTGGGSIRLTNASNSYTGTTTLANGTLIITSQDQLGDSNTAIVVTENNPVAGNTGFVGYQGGSLVLDGSSGGLTFDRDLSLQGSGPLGGRSAALVSIGNNTLSGVVSLAAGATPRNTRLTSSNGLLTLSGTLNVGGTAGTTISTLGGTNTAGAGGSYNLTGILSGTGTLEKIGAGTLFLNPSSTASFNGRLRVSGSATGGQSSVRVTSLNDVANTTNIFGTANSADASAPIDMNGGVLEIRADSSLNFGKNVYARASSTFFAGPGVGGEGINGTMTFGTFRLVANTTQTFNSRNGYGITFGTWTQDSSNNANTITNNLAGVLTFTGNAWNNSDGSARTLTIGGNGNTVITGSINSSGAGVKTLTKSGAGSLTIAGTSTTLGGNVNIQGGAVIITDFRSLNNNTAAIVLGNATTTGGNLIIGGTGAAATIAGLTTSKTITLNTTTASNSIYANQTGANPVILNGAISKIGASTTANLILGGTNTSDNIINVVIPGGGTVTGGLIKLGSGTWVLNAANTYIGATTIQNGTLKLRATAGASNVIGSVSTNTVVFSADSVTQNAGGRLEFMGFLNTATTEELGALTPTAGAAKISVLANGSGSSALTFTSLGTRGAGAYVDYQPGVAATISFGTAPTVTNGILGAASASAFQTFNGVDWAALSGNQVVAFSSYTTLPVSFSGTGGAAVNYSMTASSASTGTASINTLKLIGGGSNPTLTLGGVLTLTGRALLFDNSSGTGTITGSQLGANATEVHVITNGGSTANGGASGVALTLGNALTINSLIGGTTGSFTKSGTGTLIVGGNNAFTGNVIINEGIVQLSGSTATLGVNSTAGNLTTVRQGATLDINAAGASQTINLGALAGAGVITNSGAGVGTAGTISFGRSTSTGTTVFSGVLQDGVGTGGGVLNVTVDGTTARTQAFLGQSTYTGVTTIATGAQLTVNTLANGGSASGIGASSNAAGNLVFNGTAPTLIYQGNLRDGSLNLGSTSAITDRLFTVSGSGVVLSSTASNNNAIIWSNAGAIVHGGTAQNRLFTLTGTSTGDNTFNPQITNSTGFFTSLTKNAAGQWNLGNANNTYTGSTTITNGILALNDNGAIHDDSPIVLNPASATSPAILQMSGTFDRNLSATPTAGTGSITWGWTINSTTGGAGFAAHTTELIVAIGGIGSPTALTWGSGGFVGTGGVQNLVLGSSTALSSVDFRNAIDLGNAQRTINVLDNTNTGADFAILSGVLSGTGNGGLRKIGGGSLKLTGANTYTGVTDINAGTLTVTSLGRSSDALNTATSVGLSGVTFDNSNAITIGNASTSNAVLQYIGAGEISDRKIRINATTGTSAGAQIHADGTGALILTNVANDMVADAGAKNLWLRGTSAAGNMITSVLANNNGALNVSIDGSATWILTGENTYSGTTTVSGGALGIGHNSALGTGAVVLSNTTGGAVFAYGGDRVISNAISEANSTNAVTAFIGDYSLTFNGAWTNPTTSSTGRFTRNNIVSGKTLTINGDYTFTSVDTSVRNWNFDGSGDTIINGVISNTQGTIGIVYLGTGSLTLGGANTYNGATTLSNGTIRLGNSEVIPDGAGKGNMVINPGEGVTATFDLNGKTETVNGLTATANGTIVIDNTSATAALLTFGANDSTVNFGTGAGTYSITDSGAGALSIAKTGTGIATIGGGAGTTTLDYSGSTTVNGGTLNINAALNSTTGIIVAGGATLNLFNGVADNLSGLTTLNLGSGAGTTTLGLNLGASTAASDRLGIAGAASTANTIQFDIVALAGFGTSLTYDLITAGSGLSSGSYTLGNLPGGFTYSLTPSDTLVQLGLTAIAGGDLFWRGDLSSSWSQISGANSNFSTDLGGATDPGASPGAGNTVVFSSTAAPYTATTVINTTLDNNFFINALKFTANPTGVTSITIAPGALASNTLTIAPASSTEGIDVADNAGAITISAPVVVGADQTWNVAGTGANGSSLTLSGALSGTSNLTKTGGGNLLLSGDFTGFTGDIAINGGVINVARTGTFAVSNLITGTGALTKSGSGIMTLNNNANSFAGDLTLSGGTLEFTTVSNVGGPASSLGQGGAITLAGGTLSFIGGTSQSTNRTISTTASTTLSANGTSGASITYSGAITQATNNSLTLTGTAGSEGVITGGITHLGTAADLNVNSGTWTLSGTASIIADDVIVTGSSAVLNLNSTGVLTGIAGNTTSNGLYARTGATINLNAANAYGSGLEFILLGDNSVGGATLNTNTHNITTPRLDLGQGTSGFTASIIGSGTVTVGTSINLYQGTVSAGLAGAGAILKGFGQTVTLSGNNSGLTGTTAVRVDNGVLELNYVTSNTTKLRAATGLDMRGGTLLITGSDTAATSQTVASLTLGAGGSSVIQINPGAGQGAVLNVNAITRAVNAQDGTIRFILPSGVQSASNGITTDTLNTLGVGTNAILGGWATVDNGSGVFFAANATNAVDGNVVAASTTLQDAVGAWSAGANISDSTGFTGTVSRAYINSLRFNAASGSDLNLADTGAGVLSIASGGILVTSNVTGSSAGILGGSLVSGAVASGVPELIITQDSSQVFEIGARINGSHSVTKSGGGTLLLSGTNYFSGYLELQNGIVQVSGGNAIGDNSLVTLATNRNTTLQLLGDETIGRLQGGQRATAADYGTVAVGAHTLTINQSASTTYSGLFTGSGTIVLNAGSTGNLNYNGQTSTGLFNGSVIVNGGLFQISGDTARLGSATAFTINGAGNFLLDNDAAANTTDRISDTATFTLNSAAGTFSGQTIVRGLANRNNDNDDAVETIGLTTFNSGASYLSLEASGGTSAQARIISAGWARNNAATVNVRGRNLGGTSAERTQFKVADANDAAMITANVGGGGVIGGTAKNVSIIPWAIGETLTGGLADGNMGNTFLSYVDNRGFVALNLANEFSTFGSAASGHNVRESLGVDLTGIAGTSINSLILDNTAIAGLDVTGSGAGQTLAVTSGAMMFTVTGGVASTAYDTTLGGFDSGITVGGTNEYLFYVVNPSSAATTSTLTATIASPLTSAADITKSGRGTLVLTGVNTAGGGARKTTLNEGVLEIADLDNIGGNTGSLVFAGGTLRFGTGLTDDISTRTTTFLEGGGTIDTNGGDFILAGSVGSGVGGLTKAGAGALTFTTDAAYTGTTTVANGRLVLNGGGHNRLTTSAALVVGSGTTSGVVQFGDLINGASNQTVSSLATSGTGTTNAIVGGNAILSTLTVDQGVATTYAGAIGGAGANENNIALVKTGGGVLTLTGASTFTGGITIKGGMLAVGNSALALGDVGNVITLGDTTGSADATLNLQNTQTYANAVNVIAGSSGALTLLGGNATTGAPTLSGAITLNNNLIIAKQGTTGAFTLSGGITGTGNVVIENMGTTGTIALTTNAVNHIGSLTHYGYATGTTTISADIGANLTAIVQNSATAALTISSANIAYAGPWTVNAGVLNITGSLTLPGLVKNGAGLLTVNNVGNVTTWDTSASQAIVINGGTVEVQGATGTAFEALGTGPGSTIADNIVLDGGFLGFNLTQAVSTFSSDRGIVVGNATGSGTGGISVASGKTVTYGGIIADNGTGADGFSKTGAGTLILTGANTYTGTTTVLAGTLQLSSATTAAGDILLGSGSAIELAGGTLALFHDGDGTSGFENIAYGDNVTVTANSTIAVNRSALSYAPYFITAANKTIRQDTLTMSNGATLTVTNSNGYGLEFTGATDLGAAAPTFSVGTANTSLQIPGLLLSGVVSGSVGITKAGNGTLKLANTANTFTGDINITNGTVEGVADASFGNAANNIQIGSNSLTEGLRISGTFATSRTIHLNEASSGIDVTGGNTFTLNNAFTFATATNALAKNDLGTLVLTQAQTGWDGVMTINQGVLRIKDAGALGTTTGITTFGNVGGALEIDGGLTGMTIAENFVFAPSNDATSVGMNGGGAIRSTNGANVLTGSILLNTAPNEDSRSRAVTFTADLGASLEIAGVVTGTVGNGTGRDSWIGLGGAGDGILSTAMALGGTLGTNRFFSINKFGTGTWTITAADAHPGTRVIIKEGTLVLSGAGTLGTPTAGQETSPTVYLNPAGELKLDNVSTDVDNRLSGRALNVSGADVTILGNAAGTTETVGAFTLREGLSIFTLDADVGGQLNFATGALTRSVGATLLIRGDQFGSAAAAGVSTFTGSSYAYIGQTGAAGTVNKGILPWAVGDTSLSGLGVGFVTSDTTANTGTSILRLLAPSEQTTDLGTADANVNLGTAEVHSALTAFNSLRLGNGGGVTLSYVPLTLHSGGLLALAGNAGIQGFSGVSYLSTTANAELILHTVGDLTLAVPIAATTGTLTKSGAGTLTLTAGNTNHGTVVVNDGVLKMGGGDQTILPGRNLLLNHGGSVDLNGTVQQFNVLESRLSAVVAQSDLFPGDTGGKVINTGVSQATLVIGSSSGTSLTFAGSIEGNIAFTRSQASASFSDWNLYSEMTYTGATLLSGGRTQMLVEASLLNTSSVEIAGGTLLYSGSNANTDFKNITNRINDTAPVTLRGGALQFNTTASLITTETMGAITLAAGNNFISMSEGGTRVNQWDLTAASLTQAAGSRATIRFSGIDATPNDDSRLFLTSAPVLTNNLIGGWAVFEREFASYTVGQGVGGLGVTPTNGYAGYSPNLINDGLATDNIRIALPAAGSTTLLTGDRVINSLNLNGAASSTGNSTLDLGGNRLTLVSGGLIASSATNDRAIHIINGDLTAGAFDTGGDLYLHTANLVATDMVNRDVNVSANIVNNGAGAVSLVISGDDGRGTGLDGLLSGSSVNLTGSNTYTGGTFVNAGRVILNNGSANGTSSTATGTGDLTISGGASTNGNTYQEFRTSVILGGADQIAHTATVNLNGSARLSLNGFNQTIANLIINNTGGHNPEVTTGAGTLTITGSSITASGQNASSSAFSAINGKLALAAATTTFTINPITWNSEILNPIAPNLTIGAVIEGADIIKAGNGVLRLTGSNAFTGSFDLQAGGLALGSNNALSTGLLTIGDGTFLTSTADNRIIANAYVIGGSFALRDAFNLTLNGNTTLAAGQRGISVDLAAKVLTLGGVISGDGGINKTGDGILLLNNASSYTGATTVSDGVLRYGVVNALPTGGAVSVLEGALLDITLGGSAVTLGSLAGTSATQGGVVFHGATSGTATFTVGGDNTSTAFGGIIANAAGSTLNLTKVGTGTLTLGGANQYNGATTIEDGRLVILEVAGGSALGSSQSLVFGGVTTSGILQMGDSTGAVSKTFTGISSQGSGTASQIVSGNAGMATLTFDLATTNTFVGNIGGAGSNEANLNVVKSGAGDLVISGSGTSLFSGTTTVNAGKLFMDTVGAFSATTAGLTLADGTEFALRGTTLNTVNSYGFSGTGNVITVGSSTGATLGFGLDGTGNTQLNLATGQTMDVNGTLTTAVYVNSAPVAGHKYVLINGTDANSLSGNGGVFELNPVIFNGGSFTYALSFDSGVHGGGAQQWVLTPTAQPALADVWWKGDLTGLAEGVWSATLTSGTGFPSNWADAADGLADALVPPDQNSIVHFSAAGAANFATTLGANMTIQALIFHTGNAATTVGSSNGVNTLTLGNTSDASGLTLEGGAADVGISAIVALAQSQSWNIEDTSRVLNLSGGLVGTGMTLTVNDAVTNAGTLLFSGAAATMTGTLAVNAGTLAFDDTGSLNSGLNVMLGTVSNAATLQVGRTAAATNVIIGGLGNGSFAGSRVIGGNATASTLTIGSTSGSHTFTGALGGAGANENNFNLVKAGAGTQVLDGALTYTGTTLVRAGTLQLGMNSSFVPAATISVLADAGATAVFDINGRSFTTVGDLTLGGDGAGSIAQMVDTAVSKGTVTLAGNVLYDGSLNGDGAVLGVNLLRDGGLTITSQDSTNSTSELTLNGTLTGTNFSDTLRLTFTGAGNTIVNGVISIAGANSDIQKTGTGELTVNAATSAPDDWLISGGVVNAMVSNALNAVDDVVITGTGTQGSVVVNIGGSAGTSGVHQGNEFYIRGGAHVNVLVHNGISTGTGQLLIGDSGSTSAASAGLLNLVNANISPTSLLVGTTGGQIGIITGTGTISTTGSKELRNGTIGEGITLAGNGAILKNVVGTFTFFGQRDAAATGNVEVREGELILDYTLNNNSKVGNTLVLGISSAITNPILTINGSASAATLQSVGTTTIASAYTAVNINNGSGQTATFALGGISRAVVGGAVAFRYSSVDAVATSTGPAGTVGWATVGTGLGLARLAAIDGSGNIVAASTSVANDVSAWVKGMNVINDAAFTGTVGTCEIESLTFAASEASTITIGAANRLVISSGGILVSEGLGNVNSVITGGELVGGRSSAGGILGELIIHQNNVGSSGTTGLLTIASNMVNSSGITKTGAGILVLTGSNTFRPVSQVSIFEGTLRIGGGNAIGDTSTVLIRAGATLDLNNTTETIGTLGTGNGTLALGTGKLTINQTAAGTFSGIFTGAAASSITKAGNGVLTFQGNSSSVFTGALIVNGGTFLMSGGNGRIGSTSIVLNGASLRSSQDQTSSIDRIVNSAAILLNNTAGTDGLRVDNVNQSGSRSETVGVVTVGAGHNVISATPTQNNSAAFAILVAANIARLDRGTLLVRGLSLGAASGRHGEIRSTAAIAMVGGGGAAASQNISIVPWIIGQTTDAGLGNSFVTYNATNGLRPLATGEYTTDAAGFNALANASASTNNVRFTTAATLTSTATAINSLLIDSAATARTITGPANAIEITSGAIMGVANAGINHIINGWTAITTGGGRDYTAYVPTDATGVLTVASALTSNVALVKSGVGILSLTNASNAFTDVYLNQGSVQVDNFDKLGTGDLYFFGGNLRLATGFTGDLSGKEFKLGTGGGGIDTNGVSATATNLELTGAGDFRKLGTGTLTIGDSSLLSNTGRFVVEAGVLLLNNTLGNSVGAGGLIISGATPTVRLGASNQIADTAAVEIRHGTGTLQMLDLNNFSETIESLTITTTSSGGGVVKTGATGVLTVLGDITMNANRVNDGGTTEFQNLITGSGAIGTRTTDGILDLGGVDRRIIVQTTIAVPNRNDAVIETVIQNGGIIKEGDRTLYLRAANTYAGATTINNGTLSISSAANLGDSSATNTLAINHGATLQNTGANVDLGVNRSIALDGIGGTLQSTSTNRLTVSGVISGHDCADLTVTGPGLVALSGTNTYEGRTLVNGGTLQVGVAGAGSTGTGVVTVASGATLAGSGIINGSTIIGGGAVLQAGDVTTVGTTATTVAGNGTLTFTSASSTALTVEDGGQIRIGISNTATHLSTGVADALTAGTYTDALTYISVNGTEFTTNWNVAPGSASDMDYINLTGAGSNVSIGTRANGTFGNGSILVSGISSAQLGQVFNLLDWQAVASMGGTFTTGGFSIYDATSNVMAGDLDLTGLGAGLAWDVSAFTTHGILVVVPEPSRALFIMLGLLGLMLRRRRR